MTVWLTGIGIALVVLVMAPFFFGRGGALAPAASVNSPARLSSMRDALLTRYLEDEKAHGEGRLAKSAWERRRLFLVHRYVDIARRLDYVERTKTGGGPT